MYQRIVTKEQDVIWLRTSDKPPLGRHEIAEMAFNRYILRQENPKERDGRTYKA